ncbi:MAG: formylglycine-generating enzyme family protein [Deltaproteobacteria bacterium]|nr:formylglycine-generating enzyme family protein [Deltaproteobacteria bacterium]
MRAEFVGSEGGELNTGGSSPTEAERSVSAPLGVRIPTLQSLSMVRIPSGSFLMGSPPDERGRSADEMQHKVVLDKPFLLGRIPVTQAQWRAVMGTDKSSFRTGGADCPVETVSWLEAIEFCNRLSEKDGLRPCYEVKNSLFLGLRVEWNVGADGHRLPSEAEWEYACRAGTTGATYADVDDIAWHNGNSGGHPQPCARRQPNAWGLYDMLGNVMEWVWDSYEYRSILGVAIPEGTDRGARKVVRGGSFEVDARGCRAACRTWVVRDWPSRSLGFRLARSLPEA